MAKRKTPPRYKSGPKKGQFKPKSARRSSSSRAVTKRRKAAPKRRTYRRNPRRPDVVRMLTQGTITASQVLAGKAVTRAVPEMLNLPKQGNTGLAVQVATALGVGYVSSMFFSQATSAAILAGALTAPVETVIQVANVPLLARYLSPTAQQSAVEGYKQGVRGYVQPRTPFAGYVQPGSGIGRWNGSGASAPPPSAWQGEEEFSYGMYN